MAAQANGINIKTIPLGNVESFRIHASRTLVVKSTGGMGRLGQRSIIAIQFPDAESAIAAAKTLITSNCPTVTNIDYDQGFKLWFLSKTVRDQFHKVISPIFFEQFESICWAETAVFLRKKKNTDSDFRNPHYIITPEDFIKNELFTRRVINFESMEPIRESMTIFDRSLTDLLSSSEDPDASLAALHSAWMEATKGDKPTNNFEAEALFNLMKINRDLIDRLSSAKLEKIKASL